MTARHSYHFDLGDSNVGPIGFCARINAHSKAEAVSILQEALRNTGCQVMVLAQPDGGAIEYCQVYFNPSAIDKDDIDMVDDVSWLKEGGS